jgi:hypothetical protein
LEEEEEEEANENISDDFSSEDSLIERELREF